ncbi:MAG TPA: hypothetical protein VGS78_03330 [Candidatus Sulfotelmatobacter sp.]|nr:hypothetical protein [Candidatus Sulfotelmatobacter sp.]
MNAEMLGRTVQEFLADAAGAVVLEDGAVVFDLSEARYSISGEYNRCLLHLWSTERNTVRRVLDAEVKNGTLRLAVQRMGQARPTKLEIWRERDRRSPSAKRAARVAYESKLRRAIERHFPGFAVGRLTSGVDLEKSFGPIYARGVIGHGQTAFAVLGVNASETQASIDAALTFGILWMDVCRESSFTRSPLKPKSGLNGPPSLLVEGLILFVPDGCSALVRERMANLNRAAAKWRLFEFDERHDAVVEVDCSDRGNVATRLVHATNETAALERFAESIARIRAVLPNCDVAVLSPAEVAFRWRGLEFARARVGGRFGPALSVNAFTNRDTEDHGGRQNQSQNPHFWQHRPEVGHPGSAYSSDHLHDPNRSNHTNQFRYEQEIVYGVGAEERVLEERNWAAFAELLSRLREVRHPYGPRQERLFRMHPERWLESLVMTDVSVIDERLEAESVYSQVPAFSAADRAMIDVLTLTREGRLAVVELKADEDIHLPMQGLDYWARVRWHHSRGEFLKFGYFGGREMAGEDPLLFLVAPALRVHPATDAILKYVSPEIEWAFVGIDERWREGVRVVFRKRAQHGGAEARTA